MIEIPNTSRHTLLDLNKVTTYYTTKFKGEIYNFNYKLSFLKIHYLFNSLAPVPRLIFPIGTSDSEKQNQAIEHARIYNSLAVDPKTNKLYASKVTFYLIQGNNTISLHSVLLNAQPLTLIMDLTQFLGNTILDETNLLQVEVSHIEGMDSVVINGAYTGNVTYTFDSGVQTYHHTFDW